jgi:hypothetical protein
VDYAFTCVLLLLGNTISASAELSCTLGINFPSAEKYAATLVHYLLLSEEKTKFCLAKRIEAMYHTMHEHTGSPPNCSSLHKISRVFRFCEVILKTLWNPKTFCILLSLYIQYKST